MFDKVKPVFSHSRRLYGQRLLSLYRVFGHLHTNIVIRSKVFPVPLWNK